jgi:hypothetical protein
LAMLGNFITWHALLLSQARSSWAATCTPVRFRKVVEDGTVMERRHARDYSAENTCGVEGALNNRNSGPIRQKKRHQTMGQQNISSGIDSQNLY